MQEKKNAERYLVISKTEAPATIWAENFADVLKEIRESTEKDGSRLTDDDIVLILKLDN